MQWHAPRRDDDGGRCAERGIAAVGPQTAGNRLPVSAGSQGIVRTAGTGLLIVNCPVLPQPLLSGGTGSFSMEPVMPDLLPDRLEGGTVNTPGILGLSAGISLCAAKHAAAAV
mgnify:CR=1 FL=1